MSLQLGIAINVSFILILSHQLDYWHSDNSAGLQPLCPSIMFWCRDLDEKERSATIYRSTLKLINMVGASDLVMVVKHWWRSQRTVLNLTSTIILFCLFSLGFFHVLAIFTGGYISHRWGKTCRHDAGGYSSTWQQHWRNLWQRATIVIFARSRY